MVLAGDLVPAGTTLVTPALFLLEPFNGDKAYLNVKQPKFVLWDCGSRSNLKSIASAAGPVKTPMFLQISPCVSASNRLIHNRSKHPKLCCTRTKILSRTINGLSYKTSGLSDRLRFYWPFIWARFFDYIWLDSS